MKYYEGFSFDEEESAPREGAPLADEAEDDLLAVLHARTRVYPETCVLCGQITEFKRYLCSRRAQKTVRIKTYRSGISRVYINCPQVCPRCGYTNVRIDKPLPKGVSPRWVKRRLLRNSIPFQSETACALYRFARLKALDKNPDEACYYMNQAAWASSSVSDDKSAKRCRLLAARYAGRQFAKTRDRKDAWDLCEYLREAGRFRSVQCFIKLLRKPKKTEESWDLLRAQAILAKERDASALWPDDGFDVLHSHFTKQDYQEHLQYLTEYGLSWEEIRQLREHIIEISTAFPEILFHRRGVQSILDRFKAMGVTNFYGILWYNPFMFCEAMDGICEKIDAYEPKDEIARMINEDAHALDLIGI